MRVVLLNHSDSRGGASVATYRLFAALRALGVDARMLVMHRSVDDVDIALLRPAIRRKAAFLCEHAEIFLRNGFSRKYLFKASIANCGMSVHDHPWVREADVVVLGWINQGMLSLAEIERISAPVVWIMHDMWPLTGVCHHAGSCRGYRTQCGHCPLAMGGHLAHDMSWTSLRRKAKLYGAKKINFVAVSSWLQGKCAESSLLRNQAVSMITNPFDVSGFSLSPSKPRSAYSLPDGKLVVMGAARLDDPIKGLDIAVDALNRLAPYEASAVFFGSIRNAHALDGLRLPYVHLGAISSLDSLADIYAHADVVLSTSHYETLGLTLIEGMASGCVPVAFGTGGQTDIIDHLSTGYLAKYPDAADVANGIRFALSGNIDPQKLRISAIRRFGADNVARQYVSLFEDIIASKRLP